MRVVLERLGSPKPYRRLIRVYDGDEYVYDMAELLRAGAAVQSIVDTTGLLTIEESGEYVIVETGKYRVYFRPRGDRLISLQGDLNVSPIFAFIKAKIGYTATLGLIAIHYDGLTKVEKIQQSVSSEAA
jgi:hypothetical protein